MTMTVERAKKREREKIKEGLYQGSQQMYERQIAHPRGVRWAI